MFENFSFDSPASHSAASGPVGMPDSAISLTTLDPTDTIEMVSPFSSRAASPHTTSLSTFQKPQIQPPLPLDFSLPYPVAARRNLSITSLTQTLDRYSLAQTTSAPANQPTVYRQASPAPSSCSSSTSEEEDEGYSEPSDSEMSLPPNLLTSVASASPTSSAYFDIHITPTSAPSQQSFALTRRNRATLTRLQCSATSINHLALLLEEQHPSGLPLSPTLASPLSASSGGSSNVSPERRRVSVASIGKPKKVQKSRSRKGSAASLKAMETGPALAGLAPGAMVRKGVRLRKGPSMSGAGRR